MKPRLDMDKIAKGLRAKRRGSVYAGAGYFGALQLAAEVRARFRVPRGGGRPTDPGWTERRQVALAAKTLKRLEELSAIIREHAGVSVEPLQLAALLLERTAERVTEEDAEKWVRERQILK